MSLWESTYTILLQRGVCFHQSKNAATIYNVGHVPSITHIYYVWIYVSTALIITLYFQRRFPDCFKVWYDSLGGDAIGVTWNQEGLKVSVFFFWLTILS